MATARSRITAQSQVSIPVEIRRKLGVGPGSSIEWEDREGEIVVRRAGRYTSMDVHRALFGGKKPRKRSLKELKDGIGQHLAEKHARD